MTGCSSVAARIEMIHTLIEDGFVSEEDVKILMAIDLKRANLDNLLEDIYEDMSKGVSNYMDKRIVYNETRHTLTWTIKGVTSTIHPMEGVDPDIHPEIAQRLRDHNSIRGEISMTPNEILKAIQLPALDEDKLIIHASNSPFNFPSEEDDWDLGDALEEYKQPTVCQHKWLWYVGLNKTYYYCDKCGEEMDEI
jgi:hypothetical protein